MLYMGLFWSRITARGTSSILGEEVFEEYGIGVHPASQEIEVVTYL